MPASSPESMELAIMSDFVIAYEKEHFPLGKPTVSEFIQDSLEEKGISPVLYCRLDIYNA